MADSAAPAAREAHPRGREAHLAQAVDVTAGAGDRAGRPHGVSVAVVAGRADLSAEVVPMTAIEAVRGAVSSSGSMGGGSPI